MFRTLIYPSSGACQVGLSFVNNYSLFKRLAKSDVLFCITACNTFSWQNRAFRGSERRQEHLTGYLRYHLFFCGINYSIQLAVLLILNHVYTVKLSHPTKRRNILILFSKLQIFYSRLVAQLTERTPSAFSPLFSTCSANLVPFLKQWILKLSVISGAHEVFPSTCANDLHMFKVQPFSWKHEDVLHIVLQNQATD